MDYGWAWEGLMCELRASKGRLDGWAKVGSIYRMMGGQRVSLAGEQVWAGWVDYRCKWVS